MQNNPYSINVKLIKDTNNYYHLWDNIFYWDTKMKITLYVYECMSKIDNYEIRGDIIWI